MKNFDSSFMLLKTAVPIMVPGIAFSTGLFVFSFFRSGMLARHYRSLAVAIVAASFALWIFRILFDFFRSKSRLPTSKSGS